MLIRSIKLRTFLLSILLIICAATRIVSQESTEEKTLRKSGAQYFLGSEDELLMKVNIWGFVKSPGQYLVPVDTDLISLISFAGGPVEDAKTKSIKVIRATGHNGNGTQRTVINVDVRKYIETGDDHLIPELRPGDTIVVSGSTLHFVGKFFEFASRLAVIAQIYFWVKVAAR
ncbi:MAG: polysaccharide biosynthesis/export family protein [bacterium]